MATGLYEYHCECTPDWLGDFCERKKKRTSDYIRNTRIAKIYNWLCGNCDLKEIRLFLTQLCEHYRVTLDRYCDFSLVDASK